MLFFPPANHPALPPLLPPRLLPSSFPPLRLVAHLALTTARCRPPPFRPSTYQQVLSLVEYPALLTHPLSPQIFPSDAISRAKRLHEEIGSVGAYTHSKGVGTIRARVARFIEGEFGEVLVETFDV
jgi:hypothetical protein